MIRANEFLRQAKELVGKNNPSEVDLRTAISRAYYSLYHEALSTIQTNHVHKFQESIKKIVGSKFGKQSIDEHRIAKMDEQYFKQYNVSMHTIIADTIYQIDPTESRKYRSFKYERVQCD